MAENLVRTLLRIISTFALFGAAYLFLVKPALDTTERTFDRAFESGDAITRQVSDSLRGAGVDGGLRGLDGLGGLDPDKVSKRIDTPGEARRVSRCIERAGQDTARIVRCLR